MKYNIDIGILKGEGLKLQDFGLLLFLLKQGNKEESLERLKDNKFIVEDRISEEKFQKLLQDMNQRVKYNISFRSENLAPKLQEIFPAGRKGSYSWRDSKRMTAQRLAMFFKRFINELEGVSDEAIIQAAKNYVQSFNGNYVYMKLLKYFIIKDEKKVDAEGRIYIEETSELLSFIENLEQEDELGDWTSTLK